MRRLQAGDRVRIRDEKWRVAGVAVYGAALVADVRGCDRSNRGAQARFLLPHEPVDCLTRSSKPRVVRPARWRHAARVALAGAAPSWTSIHAVARASLDVLPFQLEPVLALLRGEGCRCLIADAVGMGKTVQAGLLAAETLLRNADARVLIVTPAGLREQWRDELRDRFHLQAAILDAAGLARTRAGAAGGTNPWAIHRLAITSSDYVKRPEVIRCHEALLWDLIVFDEAHALSGRSDRAAAADALARRARTVVLLTATPHSGDEDAFRRMCGIGRLGSDGPLLVFRRSRTDAAVSGSRRAVTLRVALTPAERAMHAALAAYVRLVCDQPGAATDGARLAMSVLTRRACSSAASLARSIERRITLLRAPAPAASLQTPLPFGDERDDEEPDEVLGAAGLADRVDECARLERVLTLTRPAGRAESKLAALRRLLARVREPAIVFTEYRDTLRHLRGGLPGEPIVELHGGLTPRERADALTDFAAGRARLLLATDAASEGLNLHQRCRLVINLELPWTPLRLEQRVGRVDRIGQRRRVHAVSLVAEGTSEEAMLARLADRRSRAELAGNDTRVVDLRAEAETEAARIAAARLLIAGEQDGDAERPAPSSVEGPQLTRIRPRRRTGATSCYWLFRLLLAASDGRIVATACLPLGAAAVARLDLSAAWTRRLLDPAQPLVELTRERGVAELARAAERASERTLQVQNDRERALREELVRQQARLSADLLQPGLFGRRRERAASAQAALLDDALAASSFRLEQLSATSTLHVDSCALVFGVAID
ncbi:MAG: DEAD/DEAH box helicase [Acidimicrobiia bacterium]|nr:DEAD/DEAH box helicase [Acidimicrobiia bacterium]